MEGALTPQGIYSSRGINRKNQTCREVERNRTIWLLLLDGFCSLYFCLKFTLYIYSLILLLQKAESSLPPPGWTSCFLSSTTSSFLFPFFVYWLVSYLLLTVQMIKNMSLLKSANKLFMTQKRILLVIWLNWSHMDYLPPKSKWQWVGEKDSFPQH